MNAVILEIVKSIKYFKAQNLYPNEIKFYQKTLEIKGKKIDIENLEEVYCLACGKSALEHYLAISKIVSIKDYRIVSNLEPKVKKMIYSTHPFLSESSIRAAREIYNFLSKLEASATLIILISGGVSALIEDPLVDIETSIQVNDELLKSGLPIEQMNTVRKLFSKCKNGGFIKDLKCAKSILLIESDVFEEPQKNVGSAPFFHDAITLEQIEKLELSTVIQSHLKKNLDLIRDYQNQLSSINNPIYFELSSTRELLKYLDMKLELDKKEIDFEPISCDTKALVELFVEKIEKNREKSLFLNGGEASVLVDGEGLGGRSTHFVASLGLKIFKENIFKLNEKELRKIIIFSIATDGRDGPCDGAGAYYDYKSFLSHGEVEKFISNFDTYSYFKKCETLIYIGATGLNLMDIRGVIFI